ncbi:MAG TPA: acetylglutamate kinase [Gammaproteobacteria bacterium]|nr:acetylglutamate kinase [Gammaproteobacteria bacterium]
MARLTGNERATPATALRHAVPYIRMYKGKVFVLKAGGEAFTSPEATRALVEQIGILHQVGIRVVLVHGGGPQSTQLAERLGLTSRIVEGRRVTDEATLDVATMVLNGRINTRILAACRAIGLPAVGISGVDGGLVRAHKRSPVTLASGAIVDYGFVGDIDRVDADVVHKLLDDGLVPIVSSLSADDEGTLLNINADTVAAALACALGAEKLMLATGAPGILESKDDPRSLISYIDRAGLGRLKSEGKITDGMLPKVASIEHALAGGVRRVHVISYSLPDSLLLEVFTTEGTGTLVVDRLEHLRPEEQHGESHGA